MKTGLSFSRVAWFAVALAAVTFAAQYLILSGARP